MAYEPTTWAEGDLITAQKLNNMEGGILEAGASGGVFVTVATDGADGIVLDKTAGEINAAIAQNIPVMISYSPYSGSTIQAHLTMATSSTFYFMAYYGQSWEEFDFAYSSANDYPTHGGII